MTQPCTDPLAEARALRPLIEAEADATDDAITLTAPVVEAFARSGLFHLMVPAELGGLEAAPGTIIDVFEELSYADGSIGWSVMANASATSYVAFLAPDAAKAIVSVPEGAIAGQFAPNGQLRREDGHYRVSGRYQFGSGIGHATHAGGGGFLLDENDQPETLPSGLPAYMCYFVPRDGIELLDGWDVMGLRGTGSFDYAVKDQLIEPGWAFPIFDNEPRQGGALFRIGAIALAGLGHAGWGLGVAQRALDEIEQMVEAGRARMGGTPLSEQQVFQREFAQKTLALRSVRLLVHDVFERVVDEMERGGSLQPAQMQEMTAATAYMTEVCEAATLFAYRFAGSQGLRNPSLIQRCFRDMFTGGLHVYVDKRTYDDFGKGLLGVS